MLFGLRLGLYRKPYPGLSADQSGMPEAPPWCATKRRSDLLLHMPCHLSEIEGLRWQGGRLERGCLAHREIAGYRLFHRGHSFIAIITHPLNVSITSTLNPVNARKMAFSTPSQPPHGYQEEKEGSFELWGGGGGGGVGIWPES